MFMVVNKDKIISYLISLSTVAVLFFFSFMISKKNDEILKTSANAVLVNDTGNSVSASSRFINANSTNSVSTSANTLGNINNESEFEDWKNNKIAKIQYCIIKII